jgi:ubiquinone biosynthesis protein UbiJ
MIRSALNDKARVEITAGEIEAMHHDINRVIQDMAALQTRMDKLEEN